MSSAAPAVIFDRDGTLIVDFVYLNDPEKIVYVPGVFEALRILRDRGFKFCVATNQSGIPRGLVEVANLDEIHRRIRARLSSHGIDVLSFHSAPYMTGNPHPMRKPNPGMLLEAARWYNLDLRRSWMVGDRMTDVEAGHRAGMRSALIGDMENPADSQFAPPEIHAPDLLACARAIASRPL